MNEGKVVKEYTRAIDVINDNTERDFALSSLAFAFDYHNHFAKKEDQL